MIFIEYDKCTTCQKAKKYLDSKGLSYEKRSIKENNPQKEEIKEWIKEYKIPIDTLFNTSGIKYRELDLKNKKEIITEEQKIEILASDGMLIRRPILITKDKILIGFKEKVWDEYFNNLSK